MSFQRPEMIPPLPTSIDVALEHVMSEAAETNTPLADAVMILTAICTDLAERLDRVENTDIEAAVASTHGCLASHCCEVCHRHATPHRGCILR